VKNIAFIVEHANSKRYGGEQLAMVSLANELAKKYSVDIYTYTPKNKQKKIISRFPEFLKNTPYIRDMFVIPIVGRKLLKDIENQYDVIFTSSTTTSAYYKPKTKLITICHIIRSQKFSTLSKITKYKIFFNPLFYRIMTMLESRSLKNTDTIITIRNHQKDFIYKNFNISNKRINIVPNGINTNFFQPANVPKKNQIIFVGRGTVPKGLDLLLDAADQINANILLVLQKIDPDLLGMAKLKTNVILKINATPQELIKLYSQSKVFVLPSRDEEQPLSVLEAMACGLPVIVSKKAASNIVKNSENGYILNSLSAINLSNACNKLLLNKNFENYKNNRKCVENNFSIDNQRKLIERYIN
jgi:glycosyltransferase involved in cell wall biosynthesis